MAAALSSCHMLWFLALAHKEGFKVAAYEDSAEATLDEDRFTSAVLRPAVEWKGDAPGRRGACRPAPRGPLALLHLQLGQLPGRGPPRWLTARGRAAARRRQGPRPHPAAARRLLLAAARRPRRRGAEGRGHRDGRLHPLGAALLRGGRRPGARAPARRSTSRSTAASARSASISSPSRAARPCCGWWRATTWSSTASAPASSTASASATSGCARRTRRSSSARSPATGRTAPTPSGPGTT